MTLDEIREGIEEALNMGTLTRWEERFLVEIGDLLHRDRTLTQAQLDKIEEILDHRL